MTNSRIHAAVTRRTHDDESGEDGLSPQTAINVKSVSDEFVWLDQRYPGYQFVKQALCWNVCGWFDVVDIVTETGEARSVYFRL